MNCKTVQNDLLNASNPETPAAPVQYHLAVCPACRQFQHRLVLIERHVPMLPVWPTGARDRLLGRLAKRPVRPSVDIPPRGWALIRDRLWEPLSRHRAIAAVLAASVALVLAGSLYLRFQDEGPPPLVVHAPAVADPLVANLLERDLQLAQARTLPEKINLLAEVAAMLHGETQHLIEAPGTPDVRTLADLNELADQFCGVVEDGVVKRAADLPAGQRRKVLQPIAEQLAQASSEAETLARQRPPLRAVLERMAHAAHRGDDQLRGLCSGEKQ